MSDTEAPPSTTNGLGFLPEPETTKPTPLGFINSDVLDDSHIPAEPTPSFLPQRPAARDTSLDAELQSLEAMYAETQDRIRFDLH